MEPFSTEPIKKDHIYLPICLYCVMIPKIKILNEKYINFFCRFCQTPSTLELTQYIEMIKTGKLYKHPCETHEQVNAEYYCKNCQQWVCIDCKKSHFHVEEHPLHIFHRCTSCLNEVYTWDCSICCEFYCDKCKESKCDKTHKVDKILIYPLFGSLYEKFTLELQKAENYLNDYYKNLKDKFNSKEIEEAYDEGRKMNNQIVEIVKILLEGFKFNKGINGWAKMVSDLNISFILQKCENEEDEKEVLRFFRTNLIIQPQQGIQIFGIKENKLQVHKRISNHCSEVKYITILKDGRLASCSFDWSVRIFDMSNNYNCDIVLKGQERAFIHLVSLDSERLVACTQTGYIYIWKIMKNTFQIITLFKAHEKIINCLLSIDNNYFVSCSNDKSFKIWKGVESYNCINGRMGKEPLISLLKLKDKDCFISCSVNAIIIFWDCTKIESIEGLDLLHLKGKCNYSQCLFEHEGNQLLVGLIGKVHVIDTINYEEICSIEENSFRYISGLCSFNDKVVLTNDLGLIYVLDIKEKKYTQIQNNQCGKYIKSITRINENLYVLSS